MFLEENQRMNGTSLDPRYDFIRQFSRFDLVGPPIWYYPRSKPIIIHNIESVRHPFVELDQDFNMKYLVQGRSFQEIEILSHVFVLPTHSQWLLTFEHHIEHSYPPKQDFFSPPIEVRSFNDIDFTLNLMND